MVLVLIPMAGQATCPPNLTLTTPDSRFTDNGDGTVSDELTGLMWKQCSEGLSTTTTACDTGGSATYGWQSALGQAWTVNGVGFAGNNDWRLPNLKELASIVEQGCHEPSINETLFPVADRHG
ncbi:hypothetical protein BOW53_15155 [Solemya pervernicosa gill symbiont]|uniref:Lcl C-terminal domain-containing protein n=1 Tax=Solemya pervernicosa gill symbiont TaxID=642797 RepID=A0A1T2L0E3_9GAMM|nr:hypothetical protein BOW53_15155 [Solemya pervernicosa gill symbiont]